MILKDGQQRLKYPIVRSQRRYSCLPMSLRFLGLRFSLHYSRFSRLERRLEQAQPSMAKKLKVGAAPKDSGQRFILLSIALELRDPHIDLHSD